jgi:hypothetical protein
LGRLRAIPAGASSTISFAGSMMQGPTSGRDIGRPRIRFGVSGGIFPAAASARI